MIHRFIIMTLMGVSLLGLSACNDNDNNDNASVKGSPSARFSALFRATSNSEPSDVQDEDAGSINVTNEPNDVL